MSPGPQRSPWSFSFSFSLSLPPSFPLIPLLSSFFPFISLLLSLNYCVILVQLTLLTLPVRAYLDSCGFPLCVCICAWMALYISPCICSIIYICTPGSWHVLFGALGVCVYVHEGFPLCMCVFPLCMCVCVYLDACVSTTPGWLQAFECVH